MWTYASMSQLCSVIKFMQIVEEKPALKEQFIYFVVAVHIRAGIIYLLCV